MENGKIGDLGGTRLQRLGVEFLRCTGSCPKSGLLIVRASSRDLWDTDSPGRDTGQEQDSKDREKTP